MEAYSSNSTPKLIHRSDEPYSNGVRCGGGGCPAVYKTEGGAFLIVGRRLSDAEKAVLSIDPIEDALEVPAELLHGLATKLRG